MTEIYIEQQWDIIFCFGYHLYAQCTSAREILRRKVKGLGQEFV